MSSPADERLRAANAAVAERDRLLRLRSQLSTDLTNAEQHVQQLAMQLRKELDDVQRLAGGVNRFLNELLGGENLAREQREAFEANARYQEAMGTRDTMKAQAATVDARLANLTPEAIAAELRAARGAKETEVRERGGEQGAALLELDVRLESIDIELVPLEEALTSGHTALAKLAEIVAMLDAVRDDRESRKRANGLAGDAQARLIGFRRALGELATSGADPIYDDHPTDAFADGWIRALLGSGERASRIAAARASIDERIADVRTRIATVRTRFDELSERRAAIARERDKLLAG